MLVHAGLLLWTGILNDVDGPLYYDQAIHLLESGRFTEKRFVLYSGYILIRSFLINTGFPNEAMYLFQLLLNGLALICFFKLTQKLLNNFAVSALATLILITNFAFQRWTTHLLTESVFANLLIIFSWMLFTRPLKGWLQYLAVSAIFIWMMFTRPSGLYFLLILLPVLVYRLSLQKRPFLMFSIIITGIVSFFIVAQAGMKNGIGLDFVRPFLENHVLCYIPVQKITETPTGAGLSFREIWDYIYDNPGKSLVLMGKRFLTFWNMQRDHYSSIHNIYIAVFSFLLYALAITGMPGIYRLNRLFFIYIISMFVIFTLSVMLTCDDWSSRFFIPLIPFLIIAAAFGIKVFLRKPG